MTDGVEVTQADREAAAWYFSKSSRGQDIRAANARNGLIDDCPTVQAFARHRHTSTEAVLARRERELAEAKAEIARERARVDRLAEAAQDVLHDIGDHQHQLQRILSGRKVLALSTALAGAIRRVEFDVCG